MNLLLGLRYTDAFTKFQNSLSHLLLWITHHLAAKLLPLLIKKTKI